MKDSGHYPHFSSDYQLSFLLGQSQVTLRYAYASLE